MSDSERPIDWNKTTFDGGRREQLRQTQAMTVRQRLEALDQLTALSERMQTMPKQRGSDAGASALTSVHEPGSDYQIDGPNS